MEPIHLPSVNLNPITDVSRSFSRETLSPEELSDIPEDPEGFPVQVKGENSLYITTYNIAKLVEKFRLDPNFRMFPNANQYLINMADSCRISQQVNRLYGYMSQANLGPNLKDLYQITSFIEKHRHLFHPLIEAGDKSLYFQKSFTGLRWSFQYLNNGELVIHLHNTINVSRHRKTKKSINYNHGYICARSSQDANSQFAIGELHAGYYYREISGVVHPFHISHVNGKQKILQHFYPNGDLRDYLDANRLSPAQKKMAWD